MKKLCERVHLNCLPSSLAVVESLENHDCSKRKLGRTTLVGKTLIHSLWSLEHVFVVFEMAELFWKAVGLLCLERLVEKTGCLGSYTEGKSDNRT